MGGKLDPPNPPYQGGLESRANIQFGENHATLTVPSSSPPYQGGLGGVKPGARGVKPGC